MIRARFAAAALLIFSLLAGCDRKPKVLTFIPHDAVPTGPIYELSLEPITPLAANRPTHIAIDSVGNLYWVQESDDGHDLLFVMGDDRVPRLATLTSDRIADVLGYPGATGNIQSIAAAPDGSLYFYFSGARGANPVAGLGLYSHRTDRIRVLAGTDALMSETGFGRSLGLARGTVLSDGGSYWLWLRHTDESALFHFRYTDLPASGELNLPDARMRVTEQEHPVDLTNEHYAIVPADDDALFWYDRPGSMLYRISPTGEVSVYQSLVGLPVALSAPAPDRQGRVLIFAADSPLADVKDLSQLDLPRLRVDAPFPALLLLKDGDVQAAGRDAITAFAGLSLQTLRIDRLIADPRNQAWVGYDVSSGELLRLGIHQIDASVTK